MSLHEPARLVGADRQQREVDRPESLADLLEVAPYPVSPAKKIRRPSTSMTNPLHSARLRSKGVRAEKCCAGAAVTRSGECSACSHQSSSSMRRNPALRASRAFSRGVMSSGSKRRRSRSQRREIAVIVVIVAEKDDEIGGRSSTRTAGGADAARPDERQRARPLREHRIGEEVAGPGLNQERRMANEGDRGPRPGVERRRRLRLHRHRLRPRRPLLRDHLRDGRKRPAVRAGRIEEPLPVEMVARRSRSGLSGPAHRTAFNVAGRTKTTLITQKII